MLHRLALAIWLVSLALAPAAHPGDRGLSQVLEPSGSGSEYLSVQPGARDYDFSPVRFRWKEEISLGEKTAPEVEKEFGGLVDDAAILQRVDQIMLRLVEAVRVVGPPQVPVDVDLSDPETPRELPITVKLLQSPEVNAFSVWGGRIYVTQGLISFVRTDAELAGVLAHELAHTMLHHLQAQSRVQRKAEQAQLMLILGALLSGGEVNPGDVMVFTEWAKREVVNTHGREDESESDRFGLLYLTEAGFNPAGMLTFMERLAHRSVSVPFFQLGAAQTHPWSNERALALQQQLRELGVEDLTALKRQSALSMEAEARDEARDGTPCKSIVVKVFGDAEVEVMKLVAAGEAESVEARATAIAEQLQALFMLGLRSNHLYVQNDTLYSRLSVEGSRPTALAHFELEDAALVNMTPAEAARRALQRLQRAFSMERLAVAY